MRKEISIGVTLITCFIGLDLAVAIIQQLITAPPYSNALAAGIEGFAVGAMFAQIVILAIWSGLSPGQTMLRTFLGGAILVAMALGILVFVDVFTPRVNFVRRSWGAERYTWMVFVFLYALLQILLMLYRRWSGCSLSLDKFESLQENLKTFSLAELVAFPLFFCVPLIVLPAITESLPPVFVSLCLTGLLVACLVYAIVHLLALLQNRISPTWLGILLFFCPSILLPASLALTGSINGSMYGVPFVVIVFSIHLGAISIGTTTAIYARHVGYRFHTPNWNAAKCAEPTTDF